MRNTPGKQPGDHAGHLAGDRFGGYDTRTMGEVWKDSLESFRDGAFVAGLLNAATLLQCGVPPQTAIEVGIDEAVTQDNVSLREDIDGRKTASTVNTTETANSVSESLRQKLPQRDLERFSETFELSPAGEKLAEALAGMDAADAARLTEAVTDAVADAVKRGENYSSLEDFLTDESVERMTEAVIEEAAETLGLADADDTGVNEKKLGDSRVAALKDMAKESLTEQFRKDGELRDTAERVRQKRGSEAADVSADTFIGETEAPSAEMRTLYKDYIERNSLTYKGKNSGITLESSSKSGTIPSIENTLTHRRISADGREIINKAVYHKLTNPVKRRGGNIITATVENGWMRYLDERGATAVTFGDSIIFRPDATTTEVLEEVYHFEQNRAGLNSQYPAIQRMILNEIDAQIYLLSVADRYKIPLSEVEEIRGILESYEMQMEKLKRLVNGMIKVNKQIKTGNSTILLLDSEIPHIRFSKLLIDGEEYKPEIVYDLKNSIGVLAIGDFEGKEIRFIP